MSLLSNLDLLNDVRMFCLFSKLLHLGEFRVPSLTPNLLVIFLLEVFIFFHDSFKLIV
jgi:hypothetical protein